MTTKAVESTTGAVAVGQWGKLFAGGFRLVPVPHSTPWCRFQSLLIKPDVRFSRIRLPDESMPSPTGSLSFAAQAE